MTVPLSHGPGGTFTVPVRVDGAQARPFILDLGAGINVVSPSVRNPGPVIGHLTGFRMTGQRLDGTLYQGPALDVGGLRLPEEPTAYWGGATTAGVAGFLSAKAFEATPITLDFRNKLLVFEDEHSLGSRKREGNAVPVKVDDVRGESLQIFADVDFGYGQRGLCLVDTGQFNMQVNTRYMPLLNRPAGGTDVVAQEDRFISHLPRVSLSDAPSVQQDNIKVIFRDLIYDCVIGNSFWEDKSLTVDIAHRMLYVRQEKGEPAS